MWVRFYYNCSYVAYFNERSREEMIYIHNQTRKKYYKCYFKVREMNGMKIGAHMCTCDNMDESDKLTAMAPDFF